MNAIQNEQIAPEIVQVIIAQATARGLSINDYLRNLLGLNAGDGADLTPAMAAEEPQANPETLAALQRIAERQEKRAFTKSQHTVTMLREARAGAMWEHEPTE